MERKADQELTDMVRVFFRATQPLHFILPHLAAFCAPFIPSIRAEHGLLDSLLFRVHHAPETSEAPAILPDLPREAE